MQADLRQVRPADFADDGQAQPAALRAAPVETLEHPLALRLGNPRPIVLDLQHRRRQHPQHHIAALRRMGQGVIHQVAEQLVEQGRLALEPNRRLGFQRQRHTAGMGQGGHGHAQLTGQLAQVQALGSTFGDGPCAVFHPCQR